MERGDIIVNPYVPKVYNGKLNPAYATMYLGDDCALSYLWEKHQWYKANKWRVIGHVDFDTLYEIINKSVENDSVRTNINPLSEPRDCKGDKKRSRGKMNNAIQMINNCPCCKALPSDITITAKNIDGRFCWLVSCDMCGHKVFGYTLMGATDKWNEVEA